MRHLRAGSPSSSPPSVATRSSRSTASPHRRADTLLLALVLACHSAPAPSTPAAAAAPAPAATPVVAAPSAPAVTQPAWLGVFFRPGSTAVLRVVEQGPAATAT